MSLKRHADQLIRSAYDSVQHNAKARIKKALKNNEITKEQAEKLQEKLDKVKES